MAMHDTAHGTPHGSAYVQSLGPGQTVDTGDQVSSVVLLGIAVVGSTVAVFLNALVT
ncbi:hypothetical protein Q8W71_14675 [Methylobacterium sp. NEAU 140]|uniref:hypothetical protein n=1 Tax=Methylobacterium sp. NEAU 140 TaxID=3064945 RepID=UPI0027326C3D|nr:hypothetical protein [Methylobacterium sp. NEAU 140]MDP4023877.1 hypothetical protein [Methylobacterium sp. NEAU 140]